MGLLLVLHSTREVVARILTGMSRVALDQVSKTFCPAKGSPVHAVHDLSLTVASGEFLVVLGPSGSGKTTVLRIVAGLERADRGHVSIEGQVIDTVPPERRDLAMVFQNGALYPHLTVLENVTLGLRLRKLPRDQIAERAREIAAMLSLDDLLNRLPRELSGGERQRVALARALARKPKVLLMDEPLSNLDAPLRVRLAQEIARVHQELGVTVIYVTHDQEEAMSLGNRMAILHQGRLQQLGRAREIYERPANLFVAGFLGSPPMNLLRGFLSTKGDISCFTPDAGPSNGRADEFTIPLSLAPGAKLGLVSGREVILGVRPETIRLETASRPNAIAACVARVECRGVSSWVRLKSGERTFIAQVSARQSPQESERLFALFDPSGLCFFDPATGLALPE